MKEFQLLSSDGLMLKGKHWRTNKPVLANIQIVHGMVEYIERYDGFARYLTDFGFDVYGHSHRGHGKTARNKEELGYLAKKDGWDLLVQDVMEVSSFIRDASPDVPLIILGHSMGSFAVRNVLRINPRAYKGAILIGSGWESKGKLVAAKAAAKMVKLITGGKSRSNFMNFLLFGSYNNDIPDTRTEFDWLSRDIEMVKKYIDDPYCGFVCTAGFYDDLVTGAMRVMKPGGVDAIPKNFPILLLSGEMDPVGQYGRGVRKIADNYRKAGLVNVTVDLYPEGRHEVLNEIDRVLVYDEIIKWLDKIFDRS